MNHPRPADVALRALALFAGTSDVELDRLVAAAFPRRLTRGQVLFMEGERSEHLFVIDRGRVKVLVTSDRGDELVLSVLGAGDCLGELSVLDGADRSATVVALEDVALWVVPAEAVRALLRHSPTVALAVAEELARRVRGLTGGAADLVFLDLPRRLAKLVSANGAPAVIDLTQSELAAQLGVTRQSLNRALQRLQERGWIAVEPSGVRVLDRHALVAFAQS